MVNPINYFLRIAYDGTNYGGWQRQSNHPRTIQQTIEELLSESLGGKISVSGCGRTDAGVHASQFYCYLKSPKELPANFIFFMNKKLPPDIAFLEVIPVHENAHVCLDAESRTYDYLFHDFPDAFLARSSGRFDLSKFRPEACPAICSRLPEYTDFREFCLTPDRHNSTKVKFSSVTLFQNGDRFRIRFVADRFLRGMIRVLMHDLVLLGSGEISQQQFEAMLQGEPRSEAVKLAPPQGLFLTGVSYPYIDRQPDLSLFGTCDWNRVSRDAS